MDNCLDFDPLEYEMSDSEPLQKMITNTKTVAADSLVQSLVNTNKVVIFSKSYCPHCQNSKTLLKEKGVGYMTVELDTLNDGKTVQDTLGQMTDAPTVPRIFINGQCVGGNSDLQSLERSGELKDLLHPQEEVYTDSKKDLYYYHQR